MLRRLNKGMGVVKRKILCVSYKDSFANNVLLARKLVEKGFILLFDLRSNR